MKTSKHKITFKVIIGYFILGVLATIAGILMLSEVESFTELQRQDTSDRNAVVKTGSLILDIYENESLARAAIQLNSNDKFNAYIEKNERLMTKIDSLNAVVMELTQEVILDSIKLVMNQKLINIVDLKELKNNDKTDESINQAIKKLSSIDALLGKLTIADFVEEPEYLDRDTRAKFEEYVRILNKYNPQDSINKISQKQIDSLVYSSKLMLEKALKQTTEQRKSLQSKEQELIENDLTISRKLQELLSNLEKAIISSSQTINDQREKAVDQSKEIILVATAIGFIIIVIFSIIFLNDFWKSQRYRIKLEEANKTTSSLLKSREQLISMVSHDLRTPLSTITGYSELLQKSTYSVKDKNYVEHIRNASAYMGQLVDDLLEFSKLEKDSITMESVPFDLESHIEEIVQNTKSVVHNKPIQFILKHDPTIKYPIISDPFRMKQILYNLVVNACKFTNEGSITIQSKLLNENTQQILEISVIDTGIGISETQQKQIFKAFTQADNNQEHRRNGFGLGLTISKKLAELLGGTVVLKSVLNKGSSFTLRIPISFSDEVLVSKKVKDSDVFFDLKAIVVEDDPAMRQLLSDLLDQYGIETYLFDNAISALETIDRIEFDFVLTDIQLPKMNGLHFMETLKNHKAYKEQPIIAMTGRSNLSVEDYIESGFSEVLTKPFQTSELQEALERFFKSTVGAVREINEIQTAKEPEGFSLRSLGTFFNNDYEAMKKTLTVFLEDTNKNARLLEQAYRDNDVETLNSVSHKMLSMFKQLEVKSLVPFLITFETTDHMDSDVFSEFQKKLGLFLKDLQKYLS